MQYDTSLSNAQLTRMLDSVEPAWTLREATEIETGHHIVYRLSVATSEDTHTLFLKTTPPEKPPTVHLEARLLAGVDANSDIPVPTVMGIVDEHETLPAPYVLLSTVPGTAYSRLELPTVSDETLRELAFQSGQYLADLHAIDAVDAYGFLTHDGPPLTGEQPTGDFSAVAVADPIDSWHDCLRNWAGGTLDQLEDTRFADVAPRVKTAVDAEIGAVEGRFEPVLARIDQSIENVLVEGDEIRALIDWEFTIATTPAYDLSCVAWSLAGGPYQFADEVSGRRSLVREAVVAGYSERDDGAVVEQYHEDRSCYELLSTLRSMVHLEDWFELFDLGDRIDDAAVDLRAELDQRL